MVALMVQKLKMEKVLKEELKIKKVFKKKNLGISILKCILETI